MRSSFGPVKSRIAIVLSILSIAGILFFTLRPAGSDLAPGWSFALISGDAALAELLQNIILFIPLGVSLTLARVRPVRVIASGALLSFTVEFLQQWIPGRDPSVGDIVANTIGTAAGVLLVVTAPLWLWAPPRRSAWHALGTAGAALAIWSGTGALLRPIYAEPPYYDAWTPDTDHQGQYAGTVLSATLGPLHLAPDTISRDDPALPRSLIMAGQPLRITAIAPNQPPARRVTLVAIGDTIDQEMLLLGADGTDLVLHYSMLALRARFEQPDLRWRHGLARIAPHDTFTVQTWRDERGVCLGINSTSRCGFGYTLGDGWKLIYFPEQLPEWALRALNALWVAAWLAAIGFWSARSGDCAIRYAAAGLAIAGLLLIPTLTQLHPTPLLEWGGGAIGSALGLWLGLHDVP